VPHIYAASQDDLFFAQGLVQAQDRLFQMDLWRRSAQGTAVRSDGAELHRARRDDAPHAVSRRS
jgi:penicillin amidase